MQRISLLIAVLSVACPPHAADPKPADDAAPVVVATVGEEPVYDRDVQRLLDKATGGKQINPAALPVLKAQVLREIVDRRLVAAYARRTGLAPTEAEVEASMTEVKTKLEIQRRSLDAALAEQGLTETDLRRMAAWNLLWPKCLAKYLTDERIERCFDEHRRQFDGSRVAVSHILLRPAPDSGRNDLDALVKKAEELRSEITSGALTFEAAAARYSSGPTAAQGGSIGLIARHGAMVESFAAAAFALEPGQVSPPVVTAFGVHLIRADRIEPGAKGLDDVRAEVREALGRELMEKLAAIERRHTAVHYTGTAPHFQPGTNQLAP